MITVQMAPAEKGISVRQCREANNIIPTYCAATSATDTGPQDYYGGDCGDISVWDRRLYAYL